MYSGRSNSVLPNEIQLENEIITDKTKMLFIINQYFISTGMLFERELPLKTSQNSSYSRQKLPCDLILFRYMMF